MSENKAFKKDKWINAKVKKGSKTNYNKKRPNYKNPSGKASNCLRNKYGFVFCNDKKTTSKKKPVKKTPVKKAPPKPVKKAPVKKTVEKSRIKLLDTPLLIPNLGEYGLKRRLPFLKKAYDYIKKQKNKGFVVNENLKKRVEDKLKGKDDKKKDDSVNKIVNDMVKEVEKHNKSFRPKKEKEKKNLKKILKLFQP